MEQGIIDFCPNAIQGSASQIFLTLINALMTTKCTLSTESDYPPDFGPRLVDGDRFDFIVVGAGSAGSVVANRLSENPNWKVLLIEAGTYPSPESEIPLLAFMLQHTKEDWQYTYEPSPYLRLKDKIDCPRGKGLGGSSLINYLLYFRGHKYDYDSWAQAGNDGWDYDSLVPHFKKFENFLDEFGMGYGNDGELKITTQVDEEPIQPSLTEAYRELGYQCDYSPEKPLGTLHPYATILNGRRYSTAKAFLGQEIKNRNNLFIALNSQVSKLLVDPELNVNGVEMRINNKLIKIYANNEVILSAGSVNSPQILMNSGIGPKEHLDEIGIEVIKNLKVGENLQDHIYLSNVDYKLHQSAIRPASETRGIDSIYNYFMHGKGYLGEAMLRFFGFVNPKNDSTAPSVQIYHIFQPQGTLSLEIFKMQMKKIHIPDSVIESITETNSLSNTIQILIGLAHPKSKGKILLRSADPFDKPLIFTNYLSDNEDVTNLIDGVRFVQKLMKTKALEAFTPELIHSNLPDCDEFSFDTDEYWDCVARNMVRTIYHLVGTCKMGPKSDPDAVVDPRLRVYGVKGLRVIDGSIMPTVVGVNTNGPIIMIGEKGSQMIKEDWINTQKDEL